MRFTRSWETLGLVQRCVYSYSMCLFQLLTIHAQLLGLAGDNSSNNQTMVTCLGEKILSFGGETSWMHCVTHIINLVEQVCLLLMHIPGLSDILLQAFLVPFKAPRCQNAKHAGTAGDVVSHYGYETDDPEVAEKVNGHLEELHQDDDEEDEAAEHELNPDGLREAASEVEEIEGEMAEELGCMSPREHQDAMFMLTKVSLHLHCVSHATYLLEGDWFGQVRGPFRPAAQSI